MTQRTFGHEEPVPSSRQPGRSFENHRRPLGDDLVEAAQREGSPLSVTERAKAVAVLRKADEFMATENPPPDDAWSIRRAIELAAGRVGVDLHEFDAIVRKDPELAALERRLMVDDAARFGRHPERIEEEGVPVAGPPPTSRH